MEDKERAEVMEAVELTIEVEDEELLDGEDVNGNVDVAVEVLAVEPKSAARVSKVLRGVSI